MKWIKDTQMYVGVGYEKPKINIMEDTIPYVHGMFKVFFTTLLVTVGHNSISSVID